MSPALSTKPPFYLVFTERALFFDWLASFLIRPAHSQLKKAETRNKDRCTLSVIEWLLTGILLPSFNQSSNDRSGR